MLKYILDPCVEEELWGIWHFIAQDNPDAATRVIEAAYETFKRWLMRQVLAGRVNLKTPS
jgi:plasmid stabilization system protein ParE